MSKISQKDSLKAKNPQLKRTDKSLEILGVEISGTHRQQLLRRIFSQRKELLHVATVNPEFVMEARSNPRFKKILAQCELTVADGWGIVWAAKALHDETIERLTGGEITKLLLEQANTRHEKVFLLGASPGVAAKAAEKMKKSYPKAEIVGYEGAETVKLEKSEEASMTIARINAYEPDYLLVAYGSPWQDIWIEENREYLRARVAVGIGGVLDEWAGIVRKCPEWLDKLGGKWLFRLVTQPWRWRRMMRVVGFALLVLYYKLID